MQGMVFNIQRFTIHDGPGLRTEIFMKGCPLSCGWCSNPEGQNSACETGIYKKKCISRTKCGLCEKECQKGALNFVRGKLVSIDRTLCNTCMKCVEVCPSEAIKQWGQLMTVEECMKTIVKDAGFYQRSGGGVTVSGGEPLLQTDFTASLLKECKNKGIHTCCESTLFADYKKIEKTAKYTDIWLVDIKHMDPKMHKEKTGVTNTLILQNLKRLVKSGADLILRIPMIPGFNDDEKNIKACADFIVNELDNNIAELQLLSFMRLGEDKYSSLGRSYPMEDLKLNRKRFLKRMNETAAYFKGRGINCIVGTKHNTEEEK